MDRDKAGQVVAIIAVFALIGVIFYVVGKGLG